MKAFLDALSKFSPAQLLTSLGILTPFVAGIWVAMKWAYDTRLKNLETALADFRADFERQLAREVAKTTDLHEKELERLRTERAEATDLHERELERLRTERAQTTDELKRISTELQATHARAKVAERRAALVAGEGDTVALLEELVAQLAELPLDYLCANPTLISKLLFSEVQVADLRIRADKGQENAMYIYGRMLITGRMLRGGTLPPNKEQGLALVRSAAESGHLPSQSFLLQS